jgi:hypothetical protein
VRVELIEGHGEHFWPRPGRVFAAAGTQTFTNLATAIDDAFARWDRSHLYGFELSDGTRIGMADSEWDGVDTLDAARTYLSRLAPGEQFLYVFDLGDDWAASSSQTSVGGEGEGATSSSPRHVSGACAPA